MVEQYYSWLPTAGLMRTLRVGPRHNTYKILAVISFKDDVGLTFFMTCRAGSFSNHKKVVEDEQKAGGILWPLLRLQASFTESLQRPVSHLKMVVVTA